LDIGLNKNNNKEEVNLPNYIDILYVVGREYWFEGFQSSKFLEGKKSRKKTALKNEMANSPFESHCCCKGLATLLTRFDLKWLICKKVPISIGSTHKHFPLSPTFPHL